MYSLRQTKVDSTLDYRALLKDQEKLSENHAEYVFIILSWDLTYDYVHAMQFCQKNRITSQACGK